MFFRTIGMRQPKEMAETDQINTFDDSNTLLEEIIAPGM